MNTIYRRFIFIVVLFFIVNSMVSQSFVKLSGKITNIKENTAGILQENTFIKFIDINADGSFSDSLQIPKAGNYAFVYARELTIIYLKPGFDLKLELNTAEFDESLKYSGKGAECNNFLAKKILISEKAFGDYFDYSDYMMDEQDFLDLRDSVNNVLYGLLENIDDHDFVDYQKREIKYDYLFALRSYESKHKNFTKDSDFKISDRFRKLYSNMDYTIEQDYQSFPSYKTMVNNHYLKGLQNVDIMDSVLLNIKEIKSYEIKEGVLHHLGESYLTVDNKDAEELYAAIERICADLEYSELFFLKYNDFKNLINGKPSPKFAYKDVNGKMVSLDDLKGKYVYIDVWATWCSPCLGEIPHLKKLEADYHDKNIAFVSISVDDKDAHDKWKKMVADKELKGYQLYADSGIDSDFIVAYHIESIPTFILIDPEGNIVSASAKRPSNPELRVLLDSLLK